MNEQKSPNAPQAPTTDNGLSADQLTGQCLIAMPAMADQRFQKTVILMCSHNTSGAMGLVLNKPHKELTFAKLCNTLKLRETDTETGADTGADTKTETGAMAGAGAAQPDQSDDPQVPIRIGGPVEISRGFVLYQADSPISQAVQVCPNIYLSAGADVLKSLARGHGPQHTLVMFGHASWVSGQLEREIRANTWLTCPYETALLFQTPPDKMYQAALQQIGVDLPSLSSMCGQA